DLHAVPLARQREATLHAAEGGKPLGDILTGNAKPVGNGNGRGGIRDIVTARHWHDKIVEPGDLSRAATADLHIEDRARAINADVHEANVGLRVFAVGNDLAVF